jgi:glycosidase
VFDHPEHLDVWSIGDGSEYLVTFRWKPGFQPSARPHVVGAFNNWNQKDLPMDGPDATGTYSVTAQIPDGEYTYKYFTAPDGYHTDPANPDGVSDGYGGQNSILRLGLSALLRDAKAERGDGQLVEIGLEHDPEVVKFLDIINTEHAVIRFRTLVGDAEGVTIVFKDEDGGSKEIAMQWAISDNMFDIYEYTWRGSPQASHYSFIVTDGPLKHDIKENFSMELSEDDIFKTPEWAKNAIWYQIMVDRFRDGDPTNNPEHTTESSTQRVHLTHPWNSDWYTEQPYEREDGKTFWEWAMYERLYGGDFQGLIDKLDYLKDLGVTAIYLNPVFESTNSHKYNARSFIHADDGYGVANSFDASVAKEDMLDSSTWEFNPSDKMLLKLIEEVHNRDMKIILDGVWNHLGDDAVPWQDVREKKQASQFADWYAVDSWDPFEYTGWGGFGGLPQFRKDSEGLENESLEQHIFDVTRRWLDPNGDGDPSDGIDGWRLDVPFEIPFPFWREWRKVVKETNPDAYIVGEVWQVATDWLDGNTMDAVMNYQFAESMFRFFGNKDQKISATRFDRELAMLRVQYPRAATYVLQNLHDSHDTDRWVSRLANPDMQYDAGNRLQDNGPNFMDERPDMIHYRRLQLMALFQACYVGAPMIWYGTEVGMYGADDPMTRMPMWWPDYGPYDNPDYIIMNDLHAEFRSLFGIRNSHANLRTGDFLALAISDEQDCYSFMRYGVPGEAPILVAVNNSDSNQLLTIKAPSSDVLAAGFKGAEVLHNPFHGKMMSASVREVDLMLPPVAGMIIKLPTP